MQEPAVERRNQGARGQSPICLGAQTHSFSHPGEGKGGIHCRKQRLLLLAGRLSDGCAPRLGWGAASGGGGASSCLLVSRLGAVVAPPAASWHIPAAGCTGPKLGYLRQHAACYRHSKQATCPNAAMATASRLLRSPGPRCPPTISTGGGSDLRRQQPHRPGLKWMNHAFNRGNARGPTSTCDRKLRLRQPWWRQWRAAPTVDIVLRGPWTPALNSLRLGVYLRLDRRQAKAAA